jgi:hypothetical protein
MIQAAWWQSRTQINNQTKSFQSNPGIIPWLLQYLFIQQGHMRGWREIFMLWILPMHCTFTSISDERQASVPKRAIITSFTAKNRHLHQYNENIVHYSTLIWALIGNLPPLWLSVTHRASTQNTQNSRNQRNRNIRIITSGTVIASCIYLPCFAICGGLAGSSNSWMLHVYPHVST